MSSRERHRQLIVAVVMAALAVAALRDLGRLGAAEPWRTMDDLPDFYCAGWALDRRANPYTYEPLHTCEHRVNVGDTFRGRLFARNPQVAFPAPLPPYDFFAFMALAQMPLRDARVIDAIAIVASVALCAFALTGSGVPFELSAAALLLSTGFVELNTGQVVQFALLALVLCGAALGRGNDRLAGILAVMTSIEPIVGLPTILATLWFVPRARWTVALTGGTFALLALSAVGGPVLLEYALRVVPAQAASEIHFPFQYSLTYALAFLNLPSGVARIAGGLCYAALLSTGLFLAPRVTQGGRREFLVFIPAFCCVIGGAYLHQEELCFALPALLMLAVYERKLARTVFAIALCVLSVPWILVWGMKQLFLASVLVCSVILLRLRIERWVAIATLGAIVLALYALELHPPHLPMPISSMQHAYAPNELVQNAWRDYVQGRSSRDVLWFAIKLPTWAALVGALALAIHCGLRPRVASEPNPESLHGIARRRPASLRARMDSSGHPS